MSIQAVLAPLFVQVALTFMVGFWLAYLGVTGVSRGEVDRTRIALREPNWPKRTMQVRNSFQNQLELPVLFYVLTVLAMMARHADLLFVVMAWIFVVSRMLHAFVHVTSNNLERRGLWYGVGAFTLALMWTVFIVRILLALP